MILIQIVLAKLSTPDNVIYSWTDSKTFYLNQDYIIPETQLHKYTRLQTKAMMQYNPEGGQSVKELLKGMLEWEKY